MSAKMIISLTPNNAAALPINPIFVVLSLKCGMSDATEAGMAMESLCLVNFPSLR